MSRSMISMVAALAAWGVGVARAGELCIDAHGVACYPQNLTPEQARQIALDGARPATMPYAGERFIVDGVCWAGDGGIGPSGQSAPAHLTYSFPKENTLWGLAVVQGVGPNDLNSKLIAAFGSGNLDLGREYMRAGLAAWRRWAGVSYNEVSDDNSPMDQDTAHVPTRGDIRIGGYPSGIQFALAYNAFPAVDAGAVVGGGDMVVNTSFFLAAYFTDPAHNYRFFRNTISHEHGHGLGLYHTIPCNHTKLMEPYLTADFDMVQVDEMRGAQRNYGDRFAGNTGPGTARDFGDLAPSSGGGPRSVREPFLSVNGVNGPGGSGEDWFRFSLGVGGPVTIGAAPVGGGCTTRGRSSRSATGFRSRRSTRAWLGTCCWNCGAPTARRCSSLPTTARGSPRASRPTSAPAPTACGWWTRARTRSGRRRCSFMISPSAWRGSRSGRGPSRG